MRTTFTTAALTTLAAVGLLASACGSDDVIPNATPDGGGEVIIDGEEFRLTSALSGFNSCDTLLDHLRTEGAERVGPYGFNNGWYGGPWPVDVMFDEVDMAVDDMAVEDAGDSGGDFDAPTASPSSTTAQGVDGEAAALAEGVDFSGTNVQEGGVDEADIVKTDGELIYIVANGELVIVDVASRFVVGSVQVPEGDRSELFLAGDDVLLINQGWFEGDISDGDAEADFAVDSVTSLEGDIAYGYGYGESRTLITRITIDGTTPRVVETLSAEGDYVSARAVDGVARIIVRANPQYSFPFVFPQNESGEERAEESNREALLESELADWLPGYERRDANGTVTDEGLLTPCDQVHAPTEFAGFGVLSVLTVGVDGDLDPSQTSAVLAPGEIVYASPDSVFVATTTWFDQNAIDTAREQIVESISTSIHRFDIASDTSAAYVASGSVEGQVRDSFSFSEHDGHLRVVTTSGNNWDETSESFLRVLRQDDDELVEVGSVGDMGNGEAVQSVRFQGDVGYVVTFRQTDPFYTVDLSDPENPVVRGELKILGFSSYLHPIGDGLVLGVGSDATQDGRVTGSKVSLFDVSNLDDPTEISTWVGPDSWNDVGWDTHAFLWWAPENLAAIPVQTWENGQQWAGVVLLRVVDGTITEVGRIDHRDETAAAGVTECDTLSADDLTSDDQSDFETEIEYMLSEGYGLVLDCADGETPSASGFSCWTDDWIGEDATRAGLEVDGTLVWCEPIGNGIPPISRSIVLPDGELWTISSPWGYLGGQGPARLQVNDLTTFERLDAVNL